MKLITLENKLRIILDRRNDLRSATLGVWVAAGSRYETKENSGISHFIEHIVFKGSEKRNAFEIARGMDSIGAQVNAYTTKEYTFFYTKALDYQILSAADILLDMIRNPRLDEKDIETEKGVILEEIAMCEDDPSDVCYESNERSIFSGSSLSLDILGTRESVSSFSKETFSSFMEKFYVPERMVIGISGNFGEEEIVEKINEYFSCCKDTGNELNASDVPFKKEYSLIKRSFEQNHLMLSFKGVGIKHEDLYSLQLCCFILGSGSSSRLNQRIREQLGLVYDISAWLGRYNGGGYIAVSLSLNEASEEMALKETCKIISQLKNDISEKELAAAKEKLTASLIMAREQPQSKLSSFGYTQLMLSEFISDDKIIEEIRAVTLEKVKEDAEKYFDLKKASFTAVGKVKEKDFYKRIIEGEKDE